LNVISFSPNQPTAKSLLPLAYRLGDRFAHWTFETGETDDGLGWLSATQRHSGLVLGTQWEPGGWVVFDAGGRALAEGTDLFDLLVSVIAEQSR
jgi:hypothetical protein